MRRGDTDDGAAMVLVLIVMVLAAFVTTAFLNKSSTQVRSSTILQSQVQIRYGADTGLEKGVRALMDDFVASPRTKCLTPLEGETALSSFSAPATGFPVSVTCNDLQGFASSSPLNPLYGAAIITTGSSSTITTQSGSSQPLDVGGSVYLGGPVAGGDLNKDVNVNGGDVAVRGCSGAPSTPGFVVVAPFTTYCTAITPQDAAPTFVLPGALPAAAPTPLDVANCRIFYPGTYTASPDLLTKKTESNYFASGLYYFQNAGDWTVEGSTTVVAGTPTIGSDQDGAGTVCGGGDAAALTATPSAAISGVGATFVFGGDSELSIKGLFAINRRIPAAPSPPIPLSIYAVRSTDPAPWTAWSGGNNPVVADAASTAEMYFNGAINAFDAPVAIFASNPTVAVARSGIVAKTLSLKASASGGALDVTGYGSTPTSGSRLIRLTSTATGSTGLLKGGGSGQAVIEFYNDYPARQPRVVSWRLQ